MRTLLSNYRELLLITESTYIFLQNVYPYFVETTGYLKKRIILLSYFIAQVW